MKNDYEKYPVRDALFSLWPSGRKIVLFSVVTTILLLSPSIYMLEVYDRVVNSRSFSTLMMLTILVVGAYVILEMMEKVRLQVAYAAGSTFEKHMRGKVFYAVYASSLSTLSGINSAVLRDLRNLHEFLGTKVFLSLVDAPLSIIVLVLLFLIHPLLGWFAVAGAMVQVGIGVFNNKNAHKPLDDAQVYAQNSRVYADGVIRNAQVIEAMGMLDNIHRRWQQFQQEFIK